MSGDRKKKNIIIAGCILAGIFLAGVITVLILTARRNPLEKGLMRLSNELTARNEEMGEHFWVNAVNQIGSGNVQAEYSVNIGGIPELQNITLGLDGKVRRDMAQKLLDSEIALSVANAEIAKASFFGTADTLYLQLPSVWEGSVVLDAADIGGQWNESAVKAGLQLLTGRELGIDGRIDINLFLKHYVNPERADDFFAEYGEELRTLYKSMEVVKMEGAQKKGLLEEAQAESLENYVLKDVDGEQIMTTCYLVILPEKELKEIFAELEGDIRLCVYLDGEKRIVRICTLPGEKLVTEAWRGEAALNLTGAEATIDRLELEVKGTAEFSVDSEIKGTMMIEKDKETQGSYQVKYDVSVADGGENLRELSFEAGVRGEQLDDGEKLSLDVERLVLKSRDQVVCRGSGIAEFMPLAEKVEMPAGKEHRIGEMNQLEAALFMAECVKNVYTNFGGYLKMLE